MADIKYLVTVDSETGTPTKLESVGDAGELTEVDLSSLSWDNGNTTRGISLVVNVYGGSSVNPQGEVKVQEPAGARFRFPVTPPPPPPPVPRR